MDNTEWFKLILQATAVTIALVTLAKAMLEFIAQGTQRRAERFLAMRERFAANPEFTTLTTLIETNSPAVADHPFDRKRAYLNFFEEVAFLINSGLLKESVAHYMFGYSIIRCWQSDHFWMKGVDRDSPYWSAFRDLAKCMMKREQGFVYARRSFAA